MCLGVHAGEDRSATSWTMMLIIQKTASQRAITESGRPRPPLKGIGEAPAVSEREVDRKTKNT